MTRLREIIAGIWAFSLAFTCNSAESLGQEVIKDPGLDHAIVASEDLVDTSTRPKYEHLMNDAMSSAESKAIVVVEKRPFSKAGRGEISLGLSAIASDIFVVYMPVTLRGAYHFREWVSLELAGSFMGCFSNEMGDNQTRASGQKCMRFLTPTYDHLVNRSNEETQLRGVKIKEYEVARFALNPVFSIFMGKFALANQGIAHFDLNVTGGLGVQIVEVPPETQNGDLTYKATFEGNFGAGIRFVFLDFVGVRMDFREYLFGKQNDKGLGTASEIALSVSFLL